MLDTNPPRQVAAADLSTYPREGVRVSIQYHKETVGLHRIRFSFTGQIGDILRRGLYAPRLIIDGTAANGLRIWCAPEGGLTPVINRSSRNWSTTLPVRRVRAREAVVQSMDVPAEWQLDDTGPVLLIPRLPDALLPQELIDKLPNSQVDPETRHDRADRRLRREMLKLSADAPTLEDEAPQLQPEPEPEAQPIEPPAAETLPADPAPVDPPSPPAADLKEAIAMVNELVDQLGDTVALSIDERGHVRARRRIVQFIDL